MNILVLANKPPFPPKDGGAIATLQMINTLADDGHTLTVYYLNTFKHTFPPADIPDTYAQKISFIAAAADTTIRWFPALTDLFSQNTPYIYQRFFKKEIAEKLTDLIHNQPFDCILFEGLAITVYLPFLTASFPGKMMLRPHNLESEIWEHLAHSAPGFFRRHYYKRLAGQIRRYERRIIFRFDNLLPISHKDAGIFQSWGYEKPVDVIPVGMDPTASNATVNKKNKKNILFLGALDWTPNLYGLTWFLKKVWPRIKQGTPDLALTVAGRNPPSRLSAVNKIPGVKLIGEIDDTKAFLNEGAVFIVPVFAGSGIRIKILEAMAAGCAVVTTTIGAAGLPVTHGKNLLLADDAIIFAQQIQTLVSDDALRNAVAENGQHLVRDYFDLSLVQQNIQKIFL